MDPVIKGAIDALRPARSKRKRWVQYGKAVHALFPLVPAQDMDEVCKAVADRLGV